MARPRTARLLLALWCLPSCQKAQPTLTLDNWWTVDYAKNGCAADHTCGSDKDNPAGVMDYIQSLRLALAVEPACRGVRVVDYRGPSSRPVALPSHGETLMIDYAAGAASQHWDILGNPSSHLQGTGTPEQIAKAACMAATGSGAQVQ